MTAKEKLLERVTRLSESEAAETLRMLESWKPGDIVDEWGNLSAMVRASTDSAMRRLDEEERAEFGETIAEAWGPGGTQQSDSEEAREPSARVGLGRSTDGLGAAQTATEPIARPPA